MASVNMSIHRSAEIERLLKCNHIPAKGASGKITAVADRYMALIELSAPSMPLASWAFSFHGLKTLQLTSAAALPLVIALLQTTMERDRLDRKYGIDGAGILYQLRQSPAAQMAVADLSERYFSTHPEVTLELVKSFLEANHIPLREVPGGAA